MTFYHKCLFPDQSVNIVHGSFFLQPYHGLHLIVLAAAYVDHTYTTFLLLTFHISDQPFTEPSGVYPHRVV